MNVGRRPFGHIRTIIRKRSESKTVTRITYVKDSVGETVNDSESTVSVDMWLFDPMEVNIKVESGDRLVGDLAGLALSGADVQVGDRIDDGSVTYEVEEVMDLPRESTPEYKGFVLERVVNDR